MAYMKLPFTLDKPSENEWVTEADKILYKDNKSVKDAIEEGGGGGGVAIPFTVTKDANNTPLGMYSNAEPNFLGKITDGAKNSTIFGPGSWADGDRVFSVSTGTPTITFSMTNTTTIKITQIQSLYVYNLMSNLTDNDFKTLVENILCRERTSTGEFDIKLTFTSVTRGTSTSNSYVTVKLSKAIATGSTTLSYYTKLSARSISLGQSNMVANMTADIMIGSSNTDLNAGNYKTVIGLYNTITNNNAQGSHTVIGRNNILTGTNAPAFLFGYNNTHDGTGYVVGSGNISGNSAITLGQNNTVGSGVYVAGYHNTLGDTNYVYGGNNTVPTGTNYIFGFNNNLNTTSTSNDIYGYNNTTTGLTNSFVMGGNNTLRGNNNIIIGTNINVEGGNINDRLIIGKNFSTSGGSLETLIGDGNNAYLRMNNDGVWHKSDKLAYKKDLDNIVITKTPNLTIFGSPTVYEGQMSRFTSADYAQFPFLVDLTDKNSFEINLCFTTGTDVVNQQNIIDSNYGLAFAIRNSRFVIALGSTGYSWNIGEHTGTLQVLPNTTYYISIRFNGSNYVVQYSLNKTSYTTDINVTDSRHLYPTKIIIGKSLDNNYIYSGSINLNYCNLLVNDVEIWQGMDDVGLATRLATDLSNIDAAGENVVKDIAGTLAGDGLSYEYGTINVNPSAIVGQGLQASEHEMSILMADPSLDINLQNNGLTVNIDYLIDGQTLVREFPDDPINKSIKVNIPENNVITEEFTINCDSTLDTYNNTELGVNLRNIAGYGLSANDTELSIDGHTLSGYGIDYDDDLDTFKVNTPQIVDNETITTTTVTTEEGGTADVLSINYDNAQELEFEFEDGSTRTFKFIAKEV